jgi:hypothetical protein
VRDHLSSRWAGTKLHSPLAATGRPGIKTFKVNKKGYIHHSAIEARAMLWCAQLDVEQKRGFGPHSMGKNLPNITVTGSTTLSTKALKSKWQGKGES